MGYIGFSALFGGLNLWNVNFWNKNMEQVQDLLDTIWKTKLKIRSTLTMQRQLLQDATLGFFA